MIITLLDGITLVLLLIFFPSAKGGFRGTVGAKADGVNYFICREECRPQAGTPPMRLYIFVFIFFFIFYLYTLYILECVERLKISHILYISYLYYTYIISSNKTA